MSSSFADIRTLKKNPDITTPILIPSFSSKGIENFDEIYINLRHYLTNVTLFSLYDLYYQFIKENEITKTKLLFLDSGFYEASKEYDLSEIYGVNIKPLEWTKKIYEKQLISMEPNISTEPNTSTVLVNYDFPGLSIESQSCKAKEIFNKYPSFIDDFLIKPEIEGQLLNIENLLNNLELLSSFSIIGVTEKELGSSILKRCQNIYKLRFNMKKMVLIFLSTYSDVWIH